MNPIMEIAKKHNLKVIEDAAQAIGTQNKDGKCVGTIGDIGCFSFFPSKNLGCFGDGGLVTTNNKLLGEKLNILRVHGGYPKYYHRIIGGNFRLDAIQAAILNVKLPHLDSWSEKRRLNASDYTRFFIEAGLAEEEGKLNFNSKNKILLPKPVYKQSGVKNYHIYNQYIIRAEKRDQLRKFLTDNAIGNEIYYPVPFHLQECFSNLNYKINDFPLAEAAAGTSIALPIFPELTKDQIQFVVQKIKEFVNI
jgi:dTDP-4-amino-4,6-dideoxygalactose transaminase